MFVFVVESEVCRESQNIKINGSKQKVLEKRLKAAAMMTQVRIIAKTKPS